MERLEKIDSGLVKKNPHFRKKGVICYSRGKPGHMQSKELSRKKEKAGQPFGFQAGTCPSVILDSHCMTEGERAPREDRLRV